jgi:rhodanese-related sulfurtransferase
MTINPTFSGYNWLLILTALFLLSNPAIAAKNTKYRSPLHVPGATTIDADKARFMFDDGVKFIDVRNPRLFARGHVPGAIHLDLKYAYSLQALEAVANRNEPIVIYTSNTKCPRAFHASRMALEWGYNKVYYFRNGIVEWRRLGFPEASLKPTK